MSDPCLLVFGATGYTGRHVVRDARSRGLRTVAHLRPGSPRSQSVGRQLEAQGAELAEVPWVEADIGALVERVRPTHVFALLGITRSGAKKEAARTGETPTYAQVDSGYSRWVVDAAAALQPAARVIYLSSLGADAPRGNAYLAARHAVEQHIFAGSAPYTVVRPSFISGADRDESRPMERVGSVVADAGLGLLGVLGAPTLRDRYATVSGAELGRCLVTAALRPAFAGRVVDMVDLRRLDG